MISLVVLAAIGQYRQCQTAATYQTVYAQPVYQQAYQNAYVEKVAFVAVEQAEDYGGLVGQQARYDVKSQRSQQELGAKIDRLSQIVQQLQGKIEAIEPPLPVKNGTPIQGSEPSPSSAANYPASESAPPPPTISSISTASTASVHREKATKILAKHCSKCHTDPSSAGGGNSIFAADGTLAKLAPEDLLLIDTAVYSGSMPKGGIPLTSDEYSAIRAWIDESRNEIALTLKQSKGRKS